MNEQIDNGNELSLSQALEQIKSRNANVFSEEKVNLAELQRRQEFQGQNSAD